MNRVGIYSGKLYSQEDYDNHAIHECCVVANPGLKTSLAIQKAKEEASFKKILNCSTCRQCEESKMDGESRSKHDI